MMNDFEWEVPYRPGSPIPITLSSKSADAIDEYQIRLPAEVPANRIDFACIDNSRREISWQTSAGDRAVLTLQVTGGETVERLVVDTATHRRPVYLPSTPLLGHCRAATDGDPSAAQTLIERFDSPVRIPLVCGSFLDLEETVALIDAITDAHRHAASQIHSYRYGIVRGAVIHRNGLTVTSSSDLETLVTGLDSIEAIGSVRLEYAIADILAIVHDSVDDTRSMLKALGYDPETIERRQDGLLFACFLAKVLITDGFRAAEGLAMDRRWYTKGNYERRKGEAENATYRERGAAWRRLICSAARDSLDELAYVLANALYWTGEVARTGSRMPELLQRGAATAAARIGLTEVEMRARFKRQMAIGHRLRSSHSFSMAVERFDAAEALAADYDFLPTWRAVHGRTIARAHALSNARDHTAAIETLEDAIERILDADLHPEQANTVIHHLTGQKLEYEAIVRRSEDEPEDAIDALEEAKTHFDAIEFSRSADRITRKLEELRSTSAAPGDSSAAKASTAGETGDRSPDDGEAIESEGSQPLPMNSRSDRLSTAEHQDWLERRPARDSPATNPDYDEIRATDYPEPLEKEPQDGRDDDPYVF